MSNTRDEQLEPMLPHDDLADQIEHMEPLAVGDQRLERKIGWIQGAAMNVSYMIGAGIFVGPALTLQLVGSGGMNLLIWFFGALVALSGTYTFMELGTMWRRNRLFGLLLSKAQISVSLPIHLLEFNEPFKWSSFASFMCNHSYLCQHLFYKNNSIFVGALVLLRIIPSDVDAGLNLSFYGTSTTLGPYASALYYVLNSYSGWHNLNYILDEVKDPIKNLPKASAAAVLSTATLYILTNAAYLIVLPLETMKNSQLVVAAAFFSRSLGDNFASNILPVFIGLSAFGCGAALNFSGGRIIMEVARQGLLPYGRIFGRVNPKVSSPVNAYLLQYALSVLFLVGIPPGSIYQFVVALTAYPVYIFYFLMALAVLILRKREPNNKRPIVAPLVPYATAILFMFACAGLWYYQIVIRDTPGKSYNESIRNQGHAAIEQELYGQYASVPTQDVT
ncbi:amino acid permease-domain-containing protein [Choanephora cucurbitarum]|nr:amino acid permease-domain-containing protein [Choanephora cucurbitarum]